MGQAQINVRTRACSRTSIARTKQASLTHNVRGKELIKITLQVYNTQFPIGDNHLNNHTNNVLAMLLQSCKHKKHKE